ncbi:hypothetical protein ILUMI_05916, partial [Ignelater luminosus]
AATTGSTLNVSDSFVNKHFSKFPKDPEYHQLWKNTCKIDASQDCRFWHVCEDHFTRSNFLNERKDRVNSHVVVPCSSDNGKTLIGILVKIQFDTGINSGILDHLKKQVIKMKPADRYCSLIFDEISRSLEFHYEQVKRYISGFEGLMRHASNDDSQEVEEQFPESEMLIDFNISELDNVYFENSQGLTYLAGWVLKGINVPDCDNCRNTLYPGEVNNHHLPTSFREIDNRQQLTYASSYVMSLVQKIRDCLYKFLETSGFQRNLVNLGQVHCLEHDCNNII